MLICESQFDSILQNENEQKRWPLIQCCVDTWSCSCTKYQCDRSLEDEKCYMMRTNRMYYCLYSEGVVLGCTGTMLCLVSKKPIGV